MPFDPEKHTNPAALRARDQELINQYQLMIDRANGTLRELGFDSEYLANLPNQPETAALLTELQDREKQDPDNYAQYLKENFHHQPERIAAAFQLFVNNLRDQYGYK